MDDGLDYQPTTEEVWPPAPTLPPPERMRMQSLYESAGVLVPVLVSIGEGTVGLATNYLQQWAGHKHHFVDRNEVYYFGGMIFTLLMPTNIWLRARILKQRRKEAVALAAQSANKEARQEARE